MKHQEPAADPRSESADSRRTRILIVDDDRYFVHPIKQYIELVGEMEVSHVASGEEARSILSDETFDCILLDVMMPPGSDEEDQLTGGFESGLILLRWLHRRYPEVPVLGFSARMDVQEYFEKSGAGFIPKSQAAPEVLEAIISAIESGGEPPKPRCFIVHGHDHAKTLQLKNFLQNSLGYPEPTILAEVASGGLTIIEKFEKVSDRVDIAFALLTADDEVEGSANRRPRQNVLFELGYFYGRIGRRSGSVIALVDKDVDIPSDMSGVVYISIKNGIESATEEIRRELKERGWNVT